MILYQLLHVHHEDDWAKDLGFFTNIEKVNKITERLSMISGFQQFPDGFLVIKRDIPGLQPETPFFEAWIYYHTDNYSTEHYIFLGFFLEKAAAEEAIQEFTELNPQSVSDFIQEQIVNKCMPNKLYWPEGFTSCGLPV